MIIKKQYAIWCVGLLLAAASTVTTAQDTSAGGAKERELLAVLQSEAAKSEKAVTCKQLAIYGTEQSVPDLALLLADKELASWARIALEAIPGPVTDAALREALGQLEGRLLIGVINSIGVRRDAGAIGVLTQKMGDTQADVAGAAAVALGHIGGAKAAKTLTQALATGPDSVRSAVAEGCILCAEQFMLAGHTTDAVELYDTVRRAPVPDQRQLEAIRGAILARGSAGVPLLIEQLESPDAKKLGIGLRSARELGGQAVTEQLAAEMDQLNPDRRPLLLMALADRHDAAVLPVVVKAAESGSQELRLTALTLLIRLGDVSCLPVLVAAMQEPDAQLGQAAMETMIRLPGEAVDAEVVATLQKTEGKLKGMLIEVAGQRQISAALPVVAASLHATDSSISNEAVQTIAIIGREQQAGTLVQMLQDSGSSADHETTRKALLAVCGRCGDKCTEYLWPLTQSRDNDLHNIGLHALAIIGGPEALGAVKSAIAQADPAVQDEAMRILSTWPNNWHDDSDAGQALLALTRSADKTSHQVLALRGYLRYVGGNSKLSNEQKVAEVKALLTGTMRIEEKRQAVAVLAQAPSVAALDLLTTLAKDAPIAEEAYSALVVVAGRDIRGVSKDQRRQVLKSVIEKSKNQGTKQRAQKALRGIR